MDLKITSYPQRIVMMYSSVDLGADGPVSCIFGSNGYYNTIERRLTPLAIHAVNHLCRGLDGVRVGILADTHRVSISPQGEDADSLFDRLCSRVGPSPREASLVDALRRDMGAIELDLIIAGSATPEAVPLPTT